MDRWIVWYNPFPVINRDKITGEKKATNIFSHCFLTEGGYEVPETKPYKIFEGETSCSDSQNYCEYLRQSGYELQKEVDEMMKVIEEFKKAKIEVIINEKWLNEQRSEKLKDILS